MMIDANQRFVELFIYTLNKKEVVY